MEMRFCKYFRGLVALSLLSLAGCAHQGLMSPEESTAAKQAKHNDIAESVTRALVLPTVQYVPQQSLNESGYLVSYIPSANPYLSNKRVIEQGSVLLFIKARRAFKAQQYEEATTLLTELTQSDKGLAGPWVMLGKIAMQQDKLAVAIQVFSKALVINPDNVNAYIGLATAQRRKGEFIQAQNTYARALAVWGDFPEAHLNLAILYDNYLNNPLKAQQHMEAYQFLTKGRDKRAGEWFADIKQRTGFEKSFIAKHAGEGAIFGNNKTDSSRQVAVAGTTE